MKAIASSRLLFVASVIAGGAVWTVFALLKTEPWDTLYGWIAVAGLGLAELLADWRRDDSKACYRRI
jgi:hypothetical protein